VRTATQVLYDAAGRPDVGAEPHGGLCYLCGGEMTAGKPAVLPQTFMDYDRVRCPESDYICDACWFSMAEQSLELARLVGKDRPQRMRNYSHFVVDGVWVPLSKGDKRGMYSLLQQSPELAVIALSGQKHIVFKAQPGRWQMEEQPLLPDPERLAWLMERVEALYNGGFAKSEIESGNYSTRRIMAYGVDPWAALEAEVQGARGSALFELAMFLCQKMEEDNGQTEDSVSVCGDCVGAVAGNVGGLQAPLRQSDLGPVPGAARRRGADDQQPGPVRQLTLF